MAQHTHLLFASGIDAFIGMQFRREAAQLSQPAMAGQGGAGTSHMHTPPNFDHLRDSFVTVLTTVEIKSDITVIWHSFLQFVRPLTAFLSILTVLAALPAKGFAGGSKLVDKLVPKQFYGHDVEPMKECSGREAIFWRYPSESMLRAVRITFCLTSLITVPLLR